APVPAPATDTELVARAGAMPLDGRDPDSRVLLHVQRVRVRVPSVEVTDQRHRLRVRRPHRHVGRVSARYRVHAQYVVEPKVPTFVEEMNVFRGEHYNLRFSWVALALARVGFAGRSSA